MKYSYSHKELVIGKPSKCSPSFLTPTPTMSSEKKSQGGTESQTLLLILAYKVKKGCREKDGVTSKKKKNKEKCQKKWH